jgi:TRAP transporter TAXI family solute receptor
VAFSSVVSENSDRIEMSAQTTGGTTANPRLIDQGQIDIGQSTHNLLWRANRDAGPYADPPIEKTICQTFSYMTLDVFLVKRQEASALEGVTRVEDLPEGTNISFGPRGTSAWDLANDGLGLLGVEDSQEYFNVSTMGLGDQADAMNDGRIDVCTCYTANQETLIGWIQQLDAQVDVDVLEWGITEDMAANAEVPVAVADVPGDTWNQEITHDPYTALPLGYTTAIPADISDDLVYEYTEILMDNVQDVRDASAVLARHGPDFATEWLQPSGVPVHPGAEQYYKDNDLWDENLTTLDEFEG